MELKNVRTPEQMLDYLISDFKTYRNVFYRPNEHRYNIITELLGEMYLIKEEYVHQTEMENENV